MIDIMKYEKDAMFDLPESERELLRERVEILIESFDALENTDTDNVPPLVSVLDLTNVLREDIPAKFLMRDEIMANAPDQHEGYFIVPATID